MGKKKQPIPRGIRNNNPGNIRHGDLWQGLSPDQSDKDFCTFLSPEYGVRAMARILLNYKKRHGLNTIHGLISRWAPSTENDTAAYIKAVAAACHVKPTEVIDVAEYLPDLIPAIIRHENGVQPYDMATIHHGIALALKE